MEKFEWLDEGYLRELLERHGIDRRDFFTWAFRTGLGFAALSLVKASPSTAAELKDKFKGQSITVTCWSGPYQTAYTNAVVKPFEELTGAKVNVEAGWTELATKLRAAKGGTPPFDVLLGSGREYELTVKYDLLLPLRRENIPNLKDVWPVFQKTYAYKEGYGAPFDFGFICLVYNPKQVYFKADSWKDLMRPEVKGKVTLGKGYWDNVFYIAAFILGDVNKIYTDLDGVFKEMKELAKQVYRWYGAGAEFVNLFAQNLATMAYYYSGSSMNLKKGGMDIEIVFPKEGAPIYEGFQLVCKGTKNRDLAEAYINYSMDPVVQARAAQIIFNTPLNRKAAPMIPKELQSVVLTDEDRLNKIFFKDWRFFTEKWDYYEERFKKEVLTV